MKTASVKDDDRGNSQANRPVTLREAPSGVVLHTEERRVEDIKPPGRAIEAVKPQSALGSLHDAIVRFSYGPEKVIKKPYGVTTDSRQRVIVTDPAGHTVHVLDLKAKDSFRIVGGENRRLQTPVGVVVDSKDNIYVSDQELGMVLVYDADGNFLRYIGDYKGENFYQRPSGIAIDNRAGRLYLLDTPRNFLYVLDLQGNILDRWGTRDGGNEPGKFRNPTQVVLHDGELIVLDTNGSRIQIVGLDGKFRSQFALKDSDNSPLEATGLTVDAHGDIYVSDEENDLVHVYDRDGHALGAFGRSGVRPGEFDSPAGLWMDSADRIYVVDSNNRRLQMFQVNLPK